VSVAALALVLGAASVALCLRGAVAPFKTNEAERANYVDEARAQDDQLVAWRVALGRRIKARQQIVADLVARRLTLAQAVDGFRALNAEDADSHARALRLHSTQESPRRRGYAATSSAGSDPCWRINPTRPERLAHNSKKTCTNSSFTRGCGQGKDADQTDVKEPVSLRRQVLEWLRADLNAWRQLLEKEPDKARPMVRQQMQHWQQAKDFAGVRGPEALAKLPIGERQGLAKAMG